MCIGILEMLYIDRTGGFEGNDVNKTSASKECDICHYWYFLNCRLKLQPKVFSRCHEFLMLPMNLSDAATLNSNPNLSGLFRGVLWGEKGGA